MLTTKLMMALFIKSVRHYAARLTTPSGSTSSKCLGRPQCMPVSTYCPKLLVLSRTRKSPSWTRSFSASRRLIRLWYQVSLRSWSSFGATGARRRGGLGHWSSRILTPPPPAWAPPAAVDILEPTAPPLASWSFRASSKGPARTVIRNVFTTLNKVRLSSLWLPECWVILSLRTYSCQRGLS